MSLSTKLVNINIVSKHKLTINRLKLRVNNGAYCNYYTQNLVVTMRRWRVL